MYIVLTFDSLFIVYMLTLCINQIQYGARTIIFSSEGGLEM